MKYQNQHNLCRKSVFVLDFHTIAYHLEEVGTGTQNRTGTWRQELMQRPWRGAAYWLALHGLLSLLSHRTQGHQPRDGAIHNGLGSWP